MLPPRASTVQLRRRRAVRKYQVILEDLDAGKSIINQEIDLTDEKRIEIEDVLRKLTEESA